MIPSQAGLVFELAVELLDGVLEKAVAKDLRLAAIANATPSRPRLVFAVTVEKL